MQCNVDELQSDPVKEFKYTASEHIDFWICLLKSTIKIFFQWEFCGDLEDALSWSSLIFKPAV